MRPRLFRGAAVLLIGCGASYAAESSSAAEIQSDAQLRAMTDELTRSKDLHLNDLARPYFIQYSASDSEELVVSASLGGLTSSNQIHMRQPRVTVRVGSYKFDNTNSIFSRYLNAGSFPLDDNYLAMRTELWLLTDVLYKTATDEIARKRNALREMAGSDQAPDFAPAKPVTLVLPLEKAEFDQKAWEGMASRLSERFVAHTAVVTSGVRLRAIVSSYRVTNTEGTVIRIPEDLTDVEIRATAVAQDGARVWNHKLLAVLEPDNLPSERDLTRAVDTVASETEALAKAPVADDYTGPVLLEQEAAAEMMAQVLTDALRLERKPLAPPGESGHAQLLESVWASRIGAKVAPDWLTIFDDARQHSYHGQVLAGQYDVDDEGVPANRVTLVDRGTLKTFLFSREPVRDYNASNGHGRLPGAYGSEEAVIGNLFIDSEKTLSEAALKAKLIEKTKAAGLKYGILIRRLDFPATASMDELQSLSQQLRKSGYSRTLTAPLLAYRVYPDGREELVRGLRFREFSAKDLRDLDAASDRSFVLNYVTNGTGINVADSGSDATVSSVVCPSLLFDNIEVAKAETEGVRAPVVPPPALVAGR